jgi:hypothetical protein
VEKFSGVASAGVVHGYVGLPDEAKWQIMLEGERAQTPPPRHSLQRVARHANAYFHLASPVEELVEEGGAVTVVTPKGRYGADLVIFATGFAVDLARRPEFSGFAHQVRLWRDAYRPAAGAEHPGLAASPYLGAHFEFLPRSPGGAADCLSHIHCFAYPAVLSHGKVTSGIPAISEGATRLARGIARSLFVEDQDLYLERFRAFAVPELLGDEWSDADLPKEASHVRA